MKSIPKALEITPLGNKVTKEHNILELPFWQDVYHDVIDVKSRSHRIYTFEDILGAATACSDVVNEI